MTDDADEITAPINHRNFTHQLKFKFYNSLAILLPLRIKMMLFLKLKVDDIQVIFVCTL